MALSVETFKSKFIDATKEKDKSLANNKDSANNTIMYSAVDIDASDANQNITMTKQQLEAIADGGLHIPGADISTIKVAAKGFTIEVNGHTVAIFIDPLDGTWLKKPETLETFKKKVSTAEKSANNDHDMFSGSEIDVTTVDEFDRLVQLSSGDNSSLDDYDKLIKDVEKGGDLESSLVDHLKEKLTDDKISEDEKKRYLKILDGMGILGAVGAQIMGDDDTESQEYTKEFSKLLGSDDSNGQVTNTHFLGEVIKYTATHKDEKMTDQSDTDYTAIQNFVKKEKSDGDFVTQFNSQEVPELSKFMQQISGDSSSNSDTSDLLPSGDSSSSDSPDTDVQKANLAFLVGAVSKTSFDALDASLAGTDDADFLANIKKESPGSYKTADDVMSLMKDVMKDQGGGLLYDDQKAVEMFTNAMANWTDSSSDITTEQKDKLVQKIADYFVRQGSKLMESENDTYQEKLMKSRKRANLLLMTDKLGLTQSVQDKLANDHKEKQSVAFADITPPVPNIPTSGYPTAGYPGSGYPSYPGMVDPFATGGVYMGMSGQNAYGMPQQPMDQQIMYQQLMYQMMGGNAYGGMPTMGSPFPGCSPSFSAYGPSPYNCLSMQGGGYGGGGYAGGGGGVYAGGGYAGGGTTIINNGTLIISPNSGNLSMGGGGGGPQIPPFDDPWGLMR